MSVYVIFGMVVTFYVSFRYFFNRYRALADTEVRDIV